MPKVQKRPSPTPELESGKPVKKLKRTPVKQRPRSKQPPSSQDDSGFPTTDSSQNDVTSTPKARKDSARSQKKTKKAVQTYASDDIKNLNVSQLLDIGEGKSCDSPEVLRSSDWGDSSDEEDDWEEVKVEEKPKEPVIPKEGVNITLEVPSYQKRKKKGFDFEAHIKRQINQVKREVQLLVHKVHILCWIAHIKYVNSLLNSETLMAVSLSLVNSKNLYPPKYSDLNYLERVVKWFHTVIEVKEHLKNPVRSKDLSEQLCYEFSHKLAYTKRHFVFMIIALLRTLGLKTRLVMSFQVVPIRPKIIELNGGAKTDSDVKDKEGTGGKSGSEVVVKKERFSNSIEGEVKIERVKNSQYFSKESASTSKDSSMKCKKKSSSTNVMVKKEGMTKLKTESKEQTNVKNKKVLKRPKDSEPSKSIPNDSDSDGGVTSKHFRPSPDKKAVKVISIGKKRNENSSNKSSPGAAASKSPSNTQEGSSICETPAIKRKPQTDKRRVKKSDGREEGRKVSGNKSVGKGRKSKLKETPAVKRSVMEKANESSDTDSDFVPQSLKKKPPAVSEADRRVFSSDEESQETAKKRGLDVWAEIFLEAEEKWICVDAVRQKIHCINDVYSRATQPVVYVIACNNDSTLKDVTRRYVPHWHSDTRKRRVDESWWNETMWPYLGPKTAQDKEEDEDINRQLLDKPLPTAISEYKDHPLYALKRHLLKFEGIYPPDAPTLGFVRGEPVYARECVVTLRSREVWYKEARVVRVRETPYKIVKARPKFDRMTGEIRKDLPLELFGFWQTEEYIPPVAVDGKVPRNEYGNVDLFKPCMLPKGTVHLQIPALNKVARKLGIDCAAAVVGFEFHSGASHPLTDGFVVCEEFKDVLLDAWNKEMDESNKKSEEKRLKRVYGNWKRLIRGLLIRERLKIKYALGDKDDVDVNDTDKPESATSSTTNSRKNAKKK